MSLISTIVIVDGGLTRTTVKQHLQAMIGLHLSRPHELRAQLDSLKERAIKNSEFDDVETRALYDHLSSQVHGQIAYNDSLPKYSPRDYIAKLRERERNRR